jgi:hypothetical protein
VMIVLGARRQGCVADETVCSVSRAVCGGHKRHATGGRQPAWWWRLDIPSQLPRYSGARRSISEKVILPVRFNRRRFLRATVGALAGAAGVASLELSRFTSTAAAADDGADFWHAQKTLITTKEDFETWIAKVIAALKTYRDSLGDTDPERNTKAAVERAIENLPATVTLANSDLEAAKHLADKYLDPIRVIRSFASLWTAGAALYAFLLRLMITRVAGGAGGIPFDAIDKILDFMIKAAKEAGDKKSAEQLEKIKKLKHAVQQGTELVDKLQEALEEFLRKHFGDK